MKLSHLLLILSQVILVSLLAAGRVRSEHMPTVFVLETSDSDSPAISSSNGESSSSSSAKSSPQDDMLTKTEIITDEAAATGNVKQVVANNTIAKSTAHSGQSESKQSNQKQNNHQRHQSNKTNSSTEGDDDEHHQVSSKTEQKPKSEHQNDASKRDRDDDHHSATDPVSSSSESVQNDEASSAARHRDNSAARRSLDSESQLAPARDKAAIGGQPPNHPGPHHHGPPPPPHHDHPHPPHHHDHPPPPPPHHKEHPPHHDDHPPHNNNERRDQTPHPTNSPSQRAKPGMTTTSSTTASSYQDQDQAPKTEERLLISITSDDDESYPRPPKQGGGPSGSQIGGYNDEPGPHQQQPHHHQKRKPAITISIQDQGRINTQNGGSGHQAVILRPTEDGIVIATLGGNNNNNNNNKLKPSGGGGGVGLLSGLLGAVSAINQQHGGSSNSHNINNNNNNEPYQEPVNNPIRPISTTRSPIINEPYNNNNNREPIGPTSHLVGSRPQQPWTDERPQKPTFDEAAANSDTTRRPTSRPTFQDTPSGPSSNQQQDYENTGGGGGPALAEQTGPKYPLNERNCGIMHETRIVGGDEADPDDFMWMAAIIKSKPRDGEPRPFCGGSLITRRHILTAAHCLEGLAPRDVLVRLGGYDFDDSASSSSADFAIDQFRVPAQYSKKTHVADIAIMRLKTPLSPNDNYKTVCMPQPRRSYVGALGTVTGYGSQSQTFRRAAPKLRQVTVPIWENRKCSAVYKKNLTESFMCAGYEEGGKDACQGDSGGPLMTEGPEQKMMIVGVVSHGIGCGAPGYPGVYTRTSTFVDWIEKNTRE